MGEVIGYPFIHVPSWVGSVLEFSVSVVEDAQGVMLVIFNVHRLLIFVRPRLIKTFYVVTIPASLIFMACDACMDLFNPDFHPNLSDIFVHLLALVLVDVVRPIIILVEDAFGVNGRGFTVVNVIYIMVVYMLFMWYPIAIGVIIRWFIPGLLTRSDSKTSRTVTLTLNVVIGYPFIHVAGWVDIVFEYSVSFVEDAEGVMLVIFNVHRLLIFLRPQFVKLFYVVTIPTSLAFIIFDSHMDTFHPDLCP
ncbi:hypothetical protein Aduo_009666 [Ancylostoma duodenale]